jgi:hypothetical protein
MRFVGKGQSGIFATALQSASHIFMHSGEPKVIMSRWF